MHGTPADSRSSTAGAATSTTSTISTSSSTSAAAGAAGGAATFQARFSATRDLLFVLMARELLVFDLELGVPASSRSLPQSKAAFAALLGVYGRGTCVGLGDEGGADVLLTQHTDHTISMWVRSPGTLTYTLVSSSRLAPPAPQRSAAASAVGMLAAASALMLQGSGSRGDSVVRCICACTREWMGDIPSPGGAPPECQRRVCCQRTRARLCTDGTGGIAVLLRHTTLPSEQLSLQPAPLLTTSTQVPETPCAKHDVHTA